MTNYTNKYRKRKTVPHESTANQSPTKARVLRGKPRKDTKWGGSTVAWAQKPLELVLQEPLTVILPVLGVFRVKLKNFHIIEYFNRCPPAHI